MQAPIAEPPAFRSQVLQPLPQHGISEYPAVFVERGAELERVFEGYVEIDVAIERVEAVL